MIDVILHAISISLFSLGIATASEDGRILWWFRNLIERNEWLGAIRKPLIMCSVCMPSIWGAIYFVLLVLFGVMPLSTNILLLWLLSVPCSAFINSALLSYVIYLDSQTDQLERNKKVQAITYPKLFK